MIRFFKYLLPHWIFILLARRRHTKLLNNLLAVRLQNDQARSDFEKSVLSKTAKANYTYQKSIEFLVDRGLIEADVRLGSIPETHLLGMCEFLQSSLKVTNFKGIQIGTYVGVSLSFLCDFASNNFKQSSLISIDPNLTHRGIEQPVNHAIEMLNHFGLLQNVMLINGYSLHKSLSNDGVNYFEKYDPKLKFNSEHAPENQLIHLAKLAPLTFDFVLLDGNHNALYLKNELELAKNLIQPNGFIVLDDVNQTWSTIQNVFNTSENFGLKNVYFDGQIGILAKMENAVEAINLPSE